MHILVRILSVLLLLGYLALVLPLLYFFRGGSETGSSPNWLSFAFPLIVPVLCLAYCFVSSFRFLQGEALQLTGILAHLLFVLFVIGSLGSGMELLVLPALLMAGAWFGMYRQKMRSRKKLL